MAWQQDRSPKVGRHRYIAKMNRIPDDEGGWMAFTVLFLSSDSFRSLSINAYRVLFRVIVEHLQNGGAENGNLIVPHRQLQDWGVTAENAADAIDELVFKGLIKVRKGRAGDGKAHPNIYTLTFDVLSTGGRATRDWKNKSSQDIAKWKEQRKIAAIRRKKHHGRNKKPR